jgi:hypothetical protein
MPNDLIKSARSCSDVFRAQPYERITVVQNFLTSLLLLVYAEQTLELYVLVSAAVTQ